MTWEMDWADRIEEERSRWQAPRTLASSAEELRSLLRASPPKARHAAAVLAAFQDACKYGMQEDAYYADLYRDAVMRLRQLEELKAHGHPKTVHDLVQVCLRLPADAEPSSEGWRVCRRDVSRQTHHFWARVKSGTQIGRSCFTSSLEEVPNKLAGMSAVGMTHALRALSRFRAASSQDVCELLRLVDASLNQWVVGVALTALASSNDRGLAWQGLPGLVELAPRLLQVVAAFPHRGPHETVSWAAPCDFVRQQQREHFASETRRAASLVLTRIEPCVLAQKEPSDASSLGVVTVSLRLGSARVRRHTLATLREVQPPSILAPLAATLLEHARGCDSHELSEIDHLIARVPDVGLERIPHVLLATRPLLWPAAALSLQTTASAIVTASRAATSTTTGTARASPAARPSPALVRQRQQLGLRVLLRLAGPCLDALLRDAQASAEGVPIEAVDDSDEAKEARLDGLLDDVAVATRGLGGEDDDPLCELAGRFVAAVEAPGGASARRHEKRVAQGCGGLVAQSLA